MERSNTIGGRIEQLRKDKGLTQAELAKAMYVRRETIVQWENGDRDLKTQATISLADFFGVTCDEILRGIKSENVDINKKTGLTANAIDILYAYSGDPDRLMALNRVLVAREFYDFLAGIATCMKIGEQKSILERNIEKMYNGFLEVAQNKEEVSTLEEGKASRIKEERVNIVDLAIFKARNPIENLSIRIAKEAYEKNYGKGDSDNGKKA